MEDLKPCPFCGGKAKLAEDLYSEAPDMGGERIPDFDEFYVQCEKCSFARLPSWGTTGYRTADWAAKAWNTRADTDEVKHLKESIQVIGFMLAQEKAEVARLREALGALVELKDHKDSNGKDDYYELRQPQVWSAARKVLGR